MDVISPNMNIDNEHAYANIVQLSYIYIYIYIHIYVYRIYTAKSRPSTPKRQKCLFSAISFYYIYNLKCKIVISEGTNYKFVFGLKTSE